MIQIKHKYTTRILLEIDGDTLQGTDLVRANLRGADLEGVNLEDADLRGANLQGAVLTGVNLRDADLRGANLRGVNLEDADLRWTNLEGADLEDADLRGANLMNAKLRDAKHRNIELIDAIGDGYKIISLNINNYRVVFTDEIMAIKYEQHLIKEWFGFSDEEIDNYIDLCWWHKWRDFIKQAIELSFNIKIN
jgi:hypothetical protein